MKRFASLLMLTLLASPGVWPLAITLPLRAESVGLQPAWTELATRLATAQNTGRPLRLAVMPLVAGAGLQDAGLGDYLAQTLVTALSAHREQFRLFERQRLDLVIKEQAFSSSELVNASQALKLGEILPLDAILTGSYLPAAEGVELQVRLLSTVTGEILASFPARVPLSTEQRTLFFVRGQTPQPSAPPANPCGEGPERIQQQLKDLSRPEKLEALVSAAIRIPFDGQRCGQIHHRVLGVLQQQKLYPPAYQRFLADTLKALTYSTDDYRMQDILYYFAADQQIEAFEWEAGLAALEKTPPGVQHIGLYRLLGSERLPASQTQERIAAYLEAVGQRRIGRPTPIGADQAFAQLNAALRNRPDQRYDLFETYHTLIGSQPSLQLEALEVLNGLIKKIPDRPRQEQILYRAAGVVAAAEPGEKFGDRLFELGHQLEQTPELQALLPRFVSLNREALVRYTREARFLNQKEDRIDFCMRHQIEIPGLIPSLAEATRDVLQAPDWERRQQAMDFLAKSQAPAARSQAALLKLLQLRDLEHQSQLEHLQAEALLVLGQQRCQQPEALNFMLKVLPRYDQMAENAQEALVLIGKPAVPAIRKQLKALNLNQTALQYKLIRILARMGKQASEARPDLIQLLPRVRHQDVRYAIEAALQAL
jgi:hypothetical protein